MPLLPKRAVQVIVERVILTPGDTHSDVLREFGTSRPVYEVEIEGMVLADVRRVGHTVVFTFEEKGD